MWVVMVTTDSVDRRLTTPLWTRSNLAHLDMMMNTRRPQSRRDSAVSDVMWTGSNLADLDMMMNTNLMSAGAT